VLVVYNTRSSVSDSVMQYYVDVRNIPSVNVVGLKYLSEDTTITYQSVTHKIKIEGWGDIIRDSNQVISTTPTFHSWKYFLDFIAGPIKTHLVDNDLEETIRYIVICKGVPFKILAKYNGGGHPYLAKGNVPIDGLLCMLNTSNYDSFIENTVYPHGIETNPYHGRDPNYTMNYRFLPDHFTTANHKLSYLVSHIDGVNYQTVVNMIDRSLAADKSGTGVWILDDDLCFPSYTTLHLQFTNARLKLASFGFNVQHDSSNMWTTHNTFLGSPIMGYSSWGTHAEDGNCSWDDSAYVADSLQFQYANGAIFNTLESFNGTSLTTLWWRNVAKIPPNCFHTQGLMTQFPVVGGTAGVAHAWEPDGTIVEFREYFTSYALGYSVVDAAYLGMKSLAWQNVVVGDPLTTIAWGKQELTQNLTWGGRNLVTGEITIPFYKTLTVNDSSYIELRHQGFIPCEAGQGRLMVGQDVTFETYSWDKALFLSHDSENARLVWADHPTFSAINYNVYRKVDDGNWEFLANTSANEYTDEEVAFTCYECYVNATVYYYVKGVDIYERESEASNEVSADVIAKIGKESAEDKQQGKAYEYSLGQNYPNPFNPITTISFSLKEAGLVQIRVYDILGNEVAALVNENQEAGNYSAKFNASRLPSGIYFYRITSGNYTATKKLILLK